MRRKPRQRGLSPLTKTLQTFKIGEKANIVLDPSIHKGQPHNRFHGKTGTVVGMQGDAYVLEVKMGGKKKKVIALPPHLKKE